MTSRTETPSNDVDASPAAILREAQATGGSAAALARLRHLASEPDAPYAVFEALAQLCFEQNLIEDAAVASEQAIARDPSQSGTWHRLGIIFMQRQEPDAARKALEQAVRLSPRFAAAQNNLGVVLQSLGLNAAAGEHYGQALAIDPDYAEAHNNLATILALAGDFDQALLHARRAADLKPGYFAPYLAAAFIESDRGRFDQALAWIAMLPRGAMRDPLVLTSHAEILVKAGRREEALVVCQSAIDLQPDLGDAVLCRATTLAALERHTEALVAFDRAAELMPASALPVARKASVLLELAREPEAIALYDRALALEPRQSSVLHMRAAAREFRLTESEIAELKNRLADEQTTSMEDRMQLHFALAGAYLRAGETASVFPHLNEGNRIKRSMIDYNSAGAERNVSDIASVFPADLLRLAAGDGSTVPIFVTGMPRSGTTLVEQILASHPKIHGAGELRAMTTVTKALEKKHGKVFPYFMNDLNFADHRVIGREYLALIGDPPAGKQHIVDKMLTNSLFAGMVHLALPNARIILCRRNPFDTCFSCYSTLFAGHQDFSYDLQELGRYYRVHDALMAHWRRVFPEENLLEINYEDVVNDIENMAKRIVAFCGLEWSDDCLRFHESKRPVRTASMLQVRKPLYSSSIGRWRPFRSELAPLFAALGMQPPD